MYQVQGAMAGTQEFFRLHPIGVRLLAWCHTCEAEQKVERRERGKLEQPDI